MTLYVIRINNKNNKVMDSKPCIHCYTMLKLFGVNKIVYSNENGLFYKTKLVDFTTNIVSKGMKGLVKA